MSSPDTSDAAPGPTGAVLGFGLPVAGRWATPSAMRRFAVAAEDAGYTSLWSFQRLLHPRDEEWGPTYHAVHDPVVALAHVAGATERIRLGIAVLNMPFHAPLVLAKQLTTLDVVSGGRLDVGLGIGWAPQEFAAVGVPMAGRGALAEEFLRCLTAVWADDPVSFDGSRYRVPLSDVAPKPVQRPRPPLLLGGSVDAALRRAGRLADGWVSASRHDLTRVHEAVTTVRRAALDAGRDPAALRFVVRGVVRLGKPRTARDGSRRPLTGSVTQVRTDLDALAEHGVTEVFVDPNFDPDVVGPDVEPERAEATAMHVLETLAPVR